MIILLAFDSYSCEKSIFTYHTQGRFYFGFEMFTIVRASRSEYALRLTTCEYSNFISLASTRDSKLLSACESKGSKNLYISKLYAETQ